MWAHRAAAAGDLDELVRIDERVFARKLSSETRTMSVRMGKKFAELGAEVTGAPLLAIMGLSMPAAAWMLCAT